MADESDVRDALAAIITGIVYPNGTSQPSIIGKTVRVYGGWPQAAALDGDLAKGVVNLSVFPKPNVTRRDSRYPRLWQRKGAKTIPTLAWSIDGDTITLSGNVSTPQNVAVIVDGQDVAYAVQATDTLASIIASLASLLGALQGISVTVVGPSLTFAGAYRIEARVGAVQPMIREVRRQHQSFIVTAWCPDPTTRDTICAAVDGALAPLNFLSLPDGSAGRIQSVSSGSFDEGQKAALYRRDLTYTVDYPTTESSSVPQVIVLRTSIQAGQVAVGQMQTGEPPAFVSIT